MSASACTEANRAIAAQRLLVSDLFTWGLNDAQASMRTLYPVEARVCAGWRESRQREFATGRYCAHRAMERLGAPQVPVGRDSNGAPVWPPGVVGSISHTRGLAFAVAAPARVVRAVGIDVECIQSPASAEALTHVLRPEEWDWLARYPRAERGLWVTVFFSARESIYKCVYGLSGIRLGIDDVTLVPVTANGRSGTVLFDFCLAANDPKGGLIGRFCVTGAYVLTSVWCLRKPAPLMSSGARARAGRHHP